MLNQFLELLRYKKYNLYAYSFKLLEIQKSVMSKADRMTIITVNADNRINFLGSWFTSNKTFKFLFFLFHQEHTPPRDIETRLLCFFCVYTILIRVFPHTHQLSLFSFLPCLHIFYMCYLHTVTLQLSSSQLSLLSSSQPQKISLYGRGSEKENENPFPSLDILNGTSDLKITLV